MVSKFIASVVLVGSVVDAGSKWKYSWPYSSTGECVCIENKNGKFGDKQSCINSFANEKFETCHNGDNKPFTQFQCANIVSKIESVSNSECKFWCSKNVEDEPIRSISFINSKCAFQFYEIKPLNSGSSNPQPSISTDMSNCYDNFIYGFFDKQQQSSSSISLSSSSPLLLNNSSSVHSVVQHVPDAQSCQLECQKKDDCIRWALRLLPQTSSSSQKIEENKNVIVSDWPFNIKYIKEYESESLPVYSCSLYSQAAVSGALSVSNEKIKNEKFCDVQKLAQCSSSENKFASEASSPCLICKNQPVCAFRSAHHIAGPKFCTKDSIKMTSKCSGQFSSSTSSYSSSDDKINNNNDEKSLTGLLSSSVIDDVVTEAVRSVLKSTTGFQISTTDLKISRADSG